MAGGCRSTVVRSIVAASLVASFAVANVAAESAHAGARPAIVVDPAPGSTSRFVAVGPLRLADTRKASCGCTHVDDHTIHVAVAGQQGAPDPIVAAAVTVTVVNGPVAGFVTAYPSGTARPETSTVNMAASAVASNSAVVPVGSDGGIDLYADVTADIVVDVTGVFTTTTFATAGRFVPVAPRRLLDTRVSPGVRVLPAASVTVPLPDGVPADATAVAVNVTSLDEFAAGFVSGYAAGATPATTSFLNPDGTGGAKAAAVILPVSASGFTIATSAGGDLVVDLVGWFTGASAASSTDGLFVPLPPTRLLDTRASGPRLWPGGTREVVLPLGAVGAVVTNITLDRTDATGFVTAYPAGTPQPPSSSLNATGRDATIANFAITQPSTRGVAYFANAGSDLIVDLAGYFTGTPAAATLPTPPNVVPRHRVFMVGDSTLGAVPLVSGTRRALLGFDYLIDAANCRRLVKSGCTSNFTTVIPTTVVEAINQAPGTFDIVVVKAGYNDPLTDFPPAVDAIVKAARAKGAKQIIWLTYSQSTSKLEYLLEQDNAILEQLAGSTAYPDLIAIDWHTYAPPSTGWYVADHHHLNVDGAWATADYLARWIAHIEHRPCPMPWTPGAAIDDPCPSPDAYAAATGTLPSLRALYGF